MLQTSQQYRIQRTQGSQQPYIARVLYQISRKPRSVHLTVSWSKHHHWFQAEFSPARCGFIADNGVCATKQKRSRGRPPAGGRLFSLKVIIRRVKTSMRPGQANIFKPPLCAKRFSFPPPILSPLFSTRFIFLSVALPPLAAAHNYREWLCELVVSTGITYPHEITIRHFAGADPA